MGMIEEDVRLPLVKASDDTSSLLARLAERLKNEKEGFFRFEC